ncbi:MAG: hypothetical protein ACR2IE_16800 [Candidatus Sumerlaeaceae bacterium]
MNLIDTVISERVHSAVSQRKTVQFLAKTQQRGAPAVLPRNTSRSGGQVRVNPATFGQMDSVRYDTQSAYCADNPDREQGAGGRAIAALGAALVASAKGPN